MKWYEKPVEEGQLIAINKMLSNFTQDRDCKLYVVSHLINRNITSTKELTLGEWGVIRDAAHPWWRDEGFAELDRHYAAKIQLLVEQYQEQVLGQLRMF